MRKAQTEAYREFAEARAGHLFRSACLLSSGDTHLAENLVQETLGRMYVVGGRMHRVGNPAAYAQTVLVRHFLTHQRRRSSKEGPAAAPPGTPAVPGKTVPRPGRDREGLPVHELFAHALSTRVAVDDGSRVTMRQSKL